MGQNSQLQSINKTGKKKIKKEKIEKIMLPEIRRKKTHIIDLQFQISKE